MQPDKAKSKLQITVSEKVIYNEIAAVKGGEIHLAFGTKGHRHYRLTDKKGVARGFYQLGVVDNLVESGWLKRTWGVITVE